MNDDSIKEGGLCDWRKLTLRQQIGQLLIMHASKVEKGLPAGGGELEDFLERYPIGGVFVGGEVIEDGTNRLEWVAERVANLRRLSRVPLLVSADLENGGGDVIPGLTPLPFPMALGAANDVSLAEDYGRACAKEGALAGINWSLSPMADLNLHPLSSNVGTRSFGDSAERVIPLLQAYCRGLRAEGMADCAKTFPGDGSDYRDQHLVTTENLLNREDWKASYGRVFQALIDDGVATIMTGHLALPCYQSPTPHPLPATLCAEIVTGLLKNEMGFQGAVTTDAFGMGGLTSGWDVPGAAVQAFVAGHDLFLWPDHHFIDEVEAGIRSGTIPMARLHDALERIWRVKKVFAKVIPKRADALDFGIEVARETAERSGTVLWDRMLPLSPQKSRRVLIVGTTPHDKAYSRFSLLAGELEARGFEVEVRRHVAPHEMPALAHAHDVILFCLERQFHRPLGPMEIFGEDARNLWAALSAGREKTIAIGFGSPYLVPWYFSHAAAGLNFYSSVPACQHAVAKLLCGEIEAFGSSPVSWKGKTSIRHLES